MVLKKLTPEVQIIDPNELPWANVWIKTNENNNVPKVVWMVVEYENGYAVCCAEYKGYIKKRTTAFEDLEEALEEFSKTKSPEPLMFVQIIGKKQIEILVDDEKQSYFWNVTENRFVQVLSDEIGKKSGKRTNPLLAGRGVQSTIAEKLDSPSTKRIKSSV